VGTGSIVFRQTLRQPIIAVGSDVVLQRGSRQIVVVIFGNIQAHGRVADDLVAADGQVYLFPQSRIDGDVLSVLGAIYRAPSVVTSGRLGGVLHAWDGQRRRHRPDVPGALQNNVRLGLAAGLALLLVGTCLTIVFPWQVVLIATTLRSSPLKSGAAGALSLLIFVFLVVPLGLSLAGLPFALMLTGAAALAWLFGITATAVVLGRVAARGPVSLLWAAAAGLVILALGLAIPVLGAVIVSLLGLAGAGALAVALIHRARPVAPLA
jgi:hypothetical protein